MTSAERAAKAGLVRRLHEMSKLDKRYTPADDLALIGVATKEAVAVSKAWSDEAREASIEARRAAAKLREHGYAPSRSDARGSGDSIWSKGGHAVRLQHADARWDYQHADDKFTPQSGLGARTLGEHLDNIKAGNARREESKHMIDKRMKDEDEAKRRDRYIHVEGDDDKRKGYGEDVHGDTIATGGSTGGSSGSGRKPKDEDEAKLKGRGDGEDDDKMDSSERANRGVARGKRKSIAGNDPWLNKSYVSGDTVREFDISDDFGRETGAADGEWGGPADEDVDLAPADTGEDALGRSYADGVLERLGGGNLSGARGDAIPSAGAGQTYEGGIPTYRPQAFMPGGEGDKGRVGGEDRGVRPVDPNMGAGTGAYTDREIGQLDGVMTRVGLNYVMRPVDPGIAPAAPAQFPDAKTSALKQRIRKGIRPGTFRSVIEDKSNLSGFAPNGF